MNTKLKYYIESMRLRTLPLSAAGILLGSLLSAAAGFAPVGVFAMALLTTLSLQILSNISNELGDLQKGTDDENRLGPIRSVQSGNLTTRDLMLMMYAFIGLSVVFGVLLVRLSFGSLLQPNAALMLALGIAAITASIKYTFGKKAYGYVGLGDVFVFVFFGLVSVCGVYFLAVGALPPALFLPASSVGLMSAAVLNVNNIRDVENDSRHCKKTLVVRMGEKGAKMYHFLLIFTAFLLMLIYSLINKTDIFGYLYLITLPVFFIHLKKIFTLHGRALDPQLKVQSLATLLFSVLAGVGSMLG